MPTPDLSALFSQALQHHQSGRLALAAGLYQQILNHNPRHADALRLLGVIAHQSNQHLLAVDLLRQAVAINPQIAEYHSNLGLALAALQRYGEAIAAFQKAMQLQPGLADAHYNLANTLKAAGRVDEAIASYQLALELQPRFPEALNNLGTALKEQRRFKPAIESFRAAIQLQPGFEAAHVNLGNALQMNNQTEEAIASYRAALRLRADNPQTHNNLAGALAGQRHFEEAIAHYQIALRADPRYAEAHFNLGNVFFELQQFEAAAAACRAALEIQPAYPEAHTNLGNALKELGKIDAAIAAYRVALVFKPDFAEAHNNLGAALKEAGQLDNAVASFRAAIQHKPDYAEAWSNLGTALKEQGLMDDAIAAYRNAVAHRPSSVVLHNNLIYGLHFHPAYAPASVAAELAEWNARHAAPLARFIKPLDIDRNPDRPLHIGLVSPDFRSHPIGRFLLPLFEAHDRTNYIFHCYSDAKARKTANDPYTQKLRAHADHWTNTVDLTDSDLAAMIRLDRIDILLDLTMHMEGSRLLTFARKPAPVQISYLAYTGHTGLETIDYRLTDNAFEPQDSPAPDPAPLPVANGQSQSELPLRLASYWCYPPPENAPPVNPLPALASYVFTLACLNNFAKVSPQALAAWIKILQAIPNSRLFLHAPPGSHRQRVRDLLASRGIDPGTEERPQRLHFHGFLPFHDYLALHHHVDLALDPFPYAGGTTSCDALFMGVPLVTLNGPHPLSRGGVSLLTQLGIPEFIAADQAAAVALAVDLAHDPPKLARIRSTLRSRMQASPLMDAAAFALNFQATLRQAWHAKLRHIA